MLLGSSFVTAVLIPPDGVSARRPGGRPCAGVSGARAARAGLRHAVRRQHHRHPLVRRRVGARGPPESRAALPAAIRHGARMGAREPAARHHHHGHQHRGDAGLSRGRRGAGRRVCHGRAGADELGGARGGDQRVAPRGAVGALLRDRRGVLLHDGHQHGGAARRHQDRVAVHSGHRDFVAGVEDASIDGAARARLRPRRDRDAVHRGSRPERIDPDHRQSSRTMDRSASTRTKCGRRGIHIT